MTHTRRAHWLRKFTHALRGLRRGVQGQSSSQVHVPAAIAVLTLGIWLPLPPIELSVLILCITLVLAAELMNSALESLAQAIARDHHPQIADALDIASGAVLATSLGAATVGSILILPPLLRRFAN